MTLRVNLTVPYQVTDAVAAVTAVEDFGQALHRTAQLALREAVGARTLDELLADKRAVGDGIRDAISGTAGELGVIKENNIYNLPAEGQDLDKDLSPLAERLNGYVKRIDRSGSVVVLHTKEPNAEDVAEVIDSANFLQIVGVIGSQRTLFIATRSIGEATHLATQIRTVSAKAHSH